MMRLVALAALSLSVSLAACGDDGDSPGGDGGADAATDGGSKPTNSLTQCTSLDMTFHNVEAFCQHLSGTLVSITVQYINKPTAASPTLIPLQLTVNGPITLNKQIDLVLGGSLSRIMGDGKDLPELESGSVILTRADCGGGGKVEGDFLAAFKPSTVGSTCTTLNGRFSAKAEKVGN